jgi:hypothetical protein
MILLSENPVDRRGNLSVPAVRSSLAYTLEVAFPGIFTPTSRAALQSRRPAFIEKLLRWAGPQRPWPRGPTRGHCPVLRGRALHHVEVESGKGADALERPPQARRRHQGGQEAQGAGRRGKARPTRRGWVRGQKWGGVDPAEAFAIQRRPTVNFPGRRSQ